MDFYDQWNEARPLIPQGKYSLRCLGGGKVAVYVQGPNGPGRSEKIILWFEVFEGPYAGAVLPMFFAIPGNGRIGQGSRYYVTWTIANRLRKPSRCRLKEMPVAIFKGKLFEGMVVTVKRKWPDGNPMPEIFDYSKVESIHDLLVG